METAKPFKFNWDEVSELNSGHTSEEWGISNKPKSKQNMVIDSEDFWNCDE
jgi:hypothetical protein